jgi:transcriptional regulator with XRE-family HTH domain
MYSGLCIKRLRMFKEIKQETVAKRLGITQQAYSKLENLDIISGNRLIEILDALNSSLKELEAVNKLYSTTPK